VKSEDFKFKLNIVKILILQMKKSDTVNHFLKEEIAQNTIYDSIKGGGL
jgi:hypothetical protein